MFLFCYFFSSLYFSFFIFFSVFFFYEEEEEKIKYKIKCRGSEQSTTKKLHSLTQIKMFELALFNSIRVSKRARFTLFFHPACTYYSRTMPVYACMWVCVWVCVLYTCFHRMKCIAQAAFPWPTQISLTEMRALLQRNVFVVVVVVFFFFKKTYKQPTGEVQ